MLGPIPENLTSTSLTGFKDRCQYVVWQNGVGSTLPAV